MARRMAVTVPMATKKVKFLRRLFRSFIRVGWSFGILSG